MAIDSLPFPEGKLLYSNCWEDAEVLLQALHPVTGMRVLSIASAGDNCLSLLTGEPDELIAVDANPVQLYLLELKAAAFSTLSYEEMLGFLGFREATNRLFSFSVIREQLTEPCRFYWEMNLPALERGVIHTGKLERYFRHYRNYILPLLAKRKTLRQYFSGPTSPEERLAYLNKLNSPFTQSLIRFFFSRAVIGALGRKKQLFSEVKANVSKHLLDVLQHFITDANSWENFYLSYITTGKWASGLPHYAREENFGPIRENLHKLRMEHGYLEEVMKTGKPVHLINASDIFEYFPEKRFQSFAGELEKLPELHKIAYWNFMVSRKLSEQTPVLHCDEGLSAALKNRDKLIFYRNFYVEVRNSPGI